MSQENNVSGKRVLIMSCSGGANVGQLSHQVVAELVQEGFARPFCLAGIGAHRRGFLRAAGEADNIVIDGCAVGCGKMILEHAEIPIKTCLVLTDLGIEKTMNPNVMREDVEKAKKMVRELYENDETTFLPKISDSDSSCCS